MTTLTGYDDIIVANYPRDAQVALGYVDGHWQTFPGLAAQCPNAFLVSITVFGGDADVCDCEQGDLTPAQAASWVQRRKAAGQRAIVYCSFSAWGDVEAACASLGVRPDGYWIADYDNDPIIPQAWADRGCVGKQYQSTATYDISTILPSWPGLPLSQGDDMPLSDPDLQKIADDVVRPLLTDFWNGQFGPKLDEIISRVKAVEDKLGVPNT